ncbi:hypothetical protein NKJ81_03885 [Mesorhizobium sp. M0018]|uniref:hypothetical protein n=1 Tax=unclassified Mesorhizobium TaxID=325217 RepID=UPI00333DAA2F
MTSHLARSHSIVLSGPIDGVFPLFTPIGETLWVDGWRIASAMFALRGFAFRICRGGLPTDH